MHILTYIQFLIIFNLTLFNQGFGEVIYEDGYTVTTVFDGNKFDINPHSLVSTSLSSHNLLLLDSSHSLFYTLSLPLSQENEVKRFAGNGLHGFSDGETNSAMFDKPRSFTMDFKGNVYVADRSNFAVRKISNSGVTTIAGGFSKAAGRSDGPGRNATFSADYELTFVRDMCALLILDHGHKLIRQIDLKAEDCGRSDSGVGSTVTWPWVVALVVSCLVGLLIGFAVRPYIKLSEDLNLSNISKSWTSYLMNLVSQTRMLYSGKRRVIASPALNIPWKAILMVRSHLSLMLSICINRVDSSCSKTVDKNHASVLDSDNSGNSESSSSQKYFDQMRELITFDQPPSSCIMCNDILKQEDVTENDEDHGQIHDLMLANITNFTENAYKSTTVIEGPFLGVSTLVKRK